MWKEILEIRLKQGFLQAGLTEIILAKKDADLSRKFWDIKGTDKEGKRLLLWRQLKYLRKLSSRDQKAKWFRSIEQLILLNMTTQEIKSNLRATYPNFLLPVLSKVEISEDNRRKEWVIAEETENLIQAGQVLCSKWNKRTSVIGVLTDLLTQKGKKELPCPITAFDSKDSLTEQAFLQRETRIDNHIKILNPADFEFIKTYNWQWKSIKKVAVSIVWSKLEKENRSLLTKEVLKNIVFGLLVEEEKQTRINIIKGLIPQDVSDSISNKIGLAKKTDKSSKL
ncbi:671_t:CDS:2 [Gigaspora rosea]|nr:671_t:CDS:2 [Gigaspora rosea]